MSILGEESTVRGEREQRAKGVCEKTRNTDAVGTATDLPGGDLACARLLHFLGGTNQSFAPPLQSQIVSASLERVGFMANAWNKGIKP